MDAYAELKCMSCGGILDATPIDGQFTCPWCGRVQRAVDAEKYVEQAKAEMMAWLSKAIPMGMNIAQTENMDPVARHNIFMTNVKPNLQANLNEYRSGLTTAASNQLIALPYRTFAANSVRHNAKMLFEFDAKAKSVSSLAVDDASKKLVNDAGMVSSVYALTLNNIQLLSKNDVDRYQFLRNNFNAAVDALKDSSDYGILRERYEALAMAAEGMDKIMNGDSRGAKPLLSEAVEKLAVVKKEATADIDYGFMTGAIGKEIIICTSGEMIAGALLMAPDLDAVEVLKTVKNLMDEFDKEESQIGGAYTTLMKRLERNSDLFAGFAKVLAAKAGEPTIRVARGSGSYYIPMWAVDIDYSFVAGSMFKKKGVKVSEMVLVSAVFTTLPSIVNSPREAVTDIFKAMPETTMMQRVKGDQTSISMGGVVKQAFDSSSMVSAESGKVIIPTTTRQEAELLCNSYMDQCKSSHSKLQMGRSVAKELLFVPCDIEGDRVKLNINLDNMAPVKYGDIYTIKEISI